MASLNESIHLFVRAGNLVFDAEDLEELALREGFKPG
jgi:hypothetical protein